MLCNHLACLSGSERRRPGWFLDMKYQTCCRRAKVPLHSYASSCPTLLMPWHSLLLPVLVRGCISIPLQDMCPTRNWQFTHLPVGFIINSDDRHITKYTYNPRNNPMLIHPQHLINYTSGDMFTLGVTKIATHTRSMSTNKWFHSYSVAGTGSNWYCLQLPLLAFAMNVFRAILHKAVYPLKPTKRRFKVWVRADEVTGYFWHIELGNHQMEIHQSWNWRVDGASAPPRLVSRSFYGCPDMQKSHNKWTTNIFSHTL